jgi:hypothetical protein
MKLLIKNHLKIFSYVPLRLNTFQVQCIYCYGLSGPDSVINKDARYSDILKSA